MYKRIASLTILAVVLTLFAGTTATAQDVVTLSYGIWDSGQLPAHEQIADEFMAENPNIKVEIEVVPWSQYWDKLQTAVAGGEAYDLFWLNADNFPVYASKGALINIQPWIDRDGIDTSVFPPALIDTYSFEGDSYGIPKDFDTIALFYNKDLFDAAGLAYPDDTWDWDDLKAAAEALTGDGIWGYASEVSLQSGYSNYIYQNGGRILNEAETESVMDEPEACEAIEFLYSFVAEGLSPDGSTMLSADPSQQLFPGGVVAMYPTGSWEAKNYSEAEPNIDVAPLPMGRDGTRASAIHGLANVIWIGTQHPDEAWEFLKFLGSEEAARIQAETGTVIPAYEGYAEVWVESIPDMNVQVFIDSLEYSFPLPTAESGSEWETRTSELLNEVWSGNLPIEGICARIAEEANAILAEGQ